MGHRSASISPPAGPDFGPPVGRVAEARALGVDPAAPQVQELRAAGLLAPGAGLGLTEKGMFLHGEVVARLA